MPAQKINQILCAVRGGPESRETVTYAIDLALKTGARLTFFHALDAEFLNHATIGPLSVVYQELVEMGKFTMLILVDRAQRRGVAEVNYVVREGNIRKQLLQAAIETKAEVMVVGRPTRSPTQNVFKFDEMEDFTAELAEVGKLQLILVPETSSQD
ncbi:MAG: universal stress protein [Anaerolineales bacterium]|nr:universal stress protein [Anaerolineales bacterium]MCA9931791.1 universal stress protein [Anaerolineales bacterium]